MYLGAATPGLDRLHGRLGPGVGDRPGRVDLLDLEVELVELLVGEDLVVAAPRQAELVEQGPHLRGLSLVLGGLGLKSWFTLGEFWSFSTITILLYLHCTAPNL